MRKHKFYMRNRWIVFRIDILRKIDRDSQALIQKNFLLGHESRWCTRPSIVPDQSSVLCCEDSDWCNLKLMPTLASDESTPSVTLNTAVLCLPPFFFL
ncbi:hypothetical protein Phum_PHUM581110 [Pediculus humanus corporis]|uniref:Uncharacterized protein n=1 Tax=Pediculus humanus subsp. corporis TaxID=121224 RepID=E0W218_PEDHC|nr:uncharacterized protein Phum_PHUM581110 [Pediculus humanus corporis]EEB19612.1 hypothetical protein Phum_PHUM581110 [Pediculus humanus corporis]